MISQRGFTLVESLVTGIIAAIIPAVIIALLKVNNGQLSQSSAQLRLAQIYDVISDDIHRAADSAGKAVGNAAKPSCGDGLVSVPNPYGVVFCDSTGTTSEKAFRLFNPIADAAGTYTTLQEWTRDNPAWRNFKVGSDSVLVDADPSSDNQKGAPGVFGLYEPANAGLIGSPPTYEALWFNLRLRTSLGGTVFKLPVQTETVICRNADPW